MRIRAEQLKQELDNPNLVLLDVRYRLSQPDWGRLEYAAGHIPGAQFVDLEKDLSTSVGTHGGRHPMPSVPHLEELFTRLGVHSNSVVVAYDGGEGMAARVWFILRYLGHRDVRLLDGGLPAWRQAGYALTSEGQDTVTGRVQSKHLQTPQGSSAAGPSPAPFVASVQPQMVVHYEDVAAIVAHEQPGLLLDARAAERYRGEVEPLDKKAGHIPGAHSFPYTEALDTDGKWLPQEQLQALFAAPLRAKEPVIAYCGSGVTACSLLYALALAGKPDARLYAGSWSDYITWDEAPIATGIAHVSEKGRGR